MSSSNSKFVPAFTATKLDIVCDDLEVGACEEVVPMDTEQVVGDMSSELFEHKTVDAEVQTLKSPAFSVFNFENDPAAIHFYTGLENYMKFFFVLNTLGPAAFCLNYVDHAVVNISVPDQFFMVLMKLRRHTTNFELSRMFGIEESVISNIFITWIIFMEKQWKELNIWPSNSLVKHFTPNSYRRNYPNTRVIFDVIECPIKKPKNPTSQKATFSTNKNRNTIKVLVGATTDGLVSYVSDAYGGSTSDRQIVERSSLVKMFSPNDSKMADKGCNVQDIFEPQISSKHVHIERPTALAKTFKILTEPMTVTETKFFSQIVFNCFMLCNFKDKN